MATSVGVHNSQGYNFFNWSSDWGRILLGVSVPLSQQKISGRFRHHVHLGFHLLLIVLGASGSPTCDCLGLPLVDSLVLVMAHETKHSMTPEIQKNLEDRTAFEILQKEGQSVSTYMLKMKAYLDQMECLGYHMPLVLGVNLILTLLSKDYDQFVQNYNMHGMWKTILELHAMLKLVEKGMPNKAPAILAIRQGTRSPPPPGKKEHLAKDTKCHHYHELGHWERNCPLYLAELKKNKAITSGTS
ncbi:zinc finger, CCHC-type containing protein, partial [Tanacetum coccineum]